MDRTYPKRVEDLNPTDLSTFLHFTSLAKSKLSAYPEFSTQFHLFRFFRNEKFHLKNSLKHIDKFVAFRNKINIEHIKSLNPSELQLIKDSSGVTKWGFDKQGRPIEIRRLSQAKFKVLMADDNKDHLKYFFVQYYERLLFIELPLASKRIGRRVDKIFMITDFKGVGFSDMLSKKFKQFMSYISFLAQESYPELTGRNFIVNAPKMFKGLYNMSNPWLKNKASRTVTVHSSIPYDKLAEFIDISKLPRFLGGTVNEKNRPDEEKTNQEIEQSIVDKTFFLKNRRFEYEFYYTEEEKKERGVGKRKKRCFGVLKDMEDLEEGEKLIDGRSVFCGLHRHSKV